jgi:hypothetical protein
MIPKKPPAAAKWLTPKHGDNKSFFEALIRGGTSEEESFQ